MRRLWRGVAAILAVIAIAFVAQRLFGTDTVTSRLVSSRPVAAIGSGSEAVAVADDGTVLTWLAIPDDVSLPALALESLPQGPRVQGPVLEQVRVLAATPAALRPYLESSYYGESGVDVMLSSGIELRFGSAGQAKRKWRSAAAVLADPDLTAVDYVDVHAPAHPATYGSGHALSPIP